MRTVHKYIIRDLEIINIPIGAKFLHFDIQNGTFYAWFEVDPTNNKEQRRFNIYGTGHDICETAKYLGTVLFGSPPSMSYVWHLYEEVV